MSALGLPPRSAHAPAPDAGAAHLRPARRARGVRRTPFEPERYSPAELPLPVVAANVAAGLLLVLVLAGLALPEWLVAGAIGGALGYGAARLERRRDSPGAHDRWEVRRDGDDVVVEHLWPVAAGAGRFRFGRDEVERHPPVDSALLARGDPRERHLERVTAATELARRAWLRRRALPEPAVPAVVDRADARVPEPLADRLLEHLRRRFAGHRHDPRWALQPLLDDLPVHLERLRGGWLSDEHDRRMEQRLEQAAQADEGVAGQISGYRRRAEPR